MYFNTCKTLDEAKNLFRELCKKLHPDTSGYDSQKDFIQMFKEFENFKPSNKSEFKKESEDFDAAKFYDIVKSFDKLTDIEINFVGSFIWLTDLLPGSMYRQKDVIKSIHLQGYKPANWASKKKSWYFSPVDYKQGFKSRNTLDEIKEKYGCLSFSKRQTLIA